MVTGVETAGLVLAAFPLLVSAAEHYREGFEKIQEWYHFRPEFTAFCHAIQTQKALFEGNLDELLAPLVISDTEMNTLLQDPGGPPWLDLEDRLKERLPRSYAQYRAIMDETNIVMRKLLKSQFGIEPKASITVCRRKHFLQYLLYRYSSRHFHSRVQSHMIPPFTLLVWSYHLYFCAFCLVSSLYETARKKPNSSNETLHIVLFLTRT